MSIYFRGKSWYYDFIHKGQCSTGSFGQVSRLVAKEEQSRKKAEVYVDALRDWVNKGDASTYALAPQEVRRRLRSPQDHDALATANFRLGQYLYQQGYQQDTQRYFTEAKRLCPESWNFKRQSWELEELGKASGPEFWAAVKALGEQAYYPPVQLERTSS